MDDRRIFRFTLSAPGRLRLRMQKARGGSQFESHHTTGSVSWMYCHHDIVHCWNPAMIQRYQDKASIE
jgi:hypothetical protein